MQANDVLAADQARNLPQLRNQARLSVHKDAKHLTALRNYDSQWRSLTRFLVS